MATKPPPNQVSHRSSVTGQWVSKTYADQHRSKTERERIYNPQRPPAATPKQPR